MTIFGSPSILVAVFVTEIFGTADASGVAAAVVDAILSLILFLTLFVNAQDVNKPAVTVSMTRYVFFINKEV